jgi:hypothetical protein
MTKRRKSYRAYAPGSVQKEVNSNLRRAISELRHGRAGCKHAREYIHAAKDLVRGASEDAMRWGSHGIGYRVGRPEDPSVMGRKVTRVVKQFRSKCGR